MKKITIIAIIFAICASVSAQEPVKDWAKTDRFAAENASVTVKPKAVFMGDSITEQWGVKDQMFFDNHNYLERGISGQTTAQMLVRMRPDVIAHHPKYVVILAGTNDIAQNLGPVALETVCGNIISMCELAKANGIKPIICSVTPCDRYSWKKDLEPAKEIIKLNGMLQAYAESAHIRYVDYFSLLTDGNDALKTEYTKDHCHLTLEGYKVIEAEIVKYLK